MCTVSLLNGLKNKINAHAGAGGVRAEKNTIQQKVTLEKVDKHKENSISR